MEETRDSEKKIYSSAPTIRQNSWLRVLTTAAFFYILLLFTFLLTDNTNLFPTLVMVGNFMVPIAFVSFLYERRHLSRMTMSTVSLDFMY